MALNAFWLSRPNIEARTRWDEHIVDDLLAGKLKRPAGFPTIDQHVVTDLPETDRAIVVFPAGAHRWDHVAWLNRQIAKIGEVVLLLTSDERSLFPVELIKHRRLHLWVQTPDPSRIYPPDTVFFPIGAPRYQRDPTPSEPTKDWCFIGQYDTPRRLEASPIFRRLRKSRSYRSTLRLNNAFASGMKRDTYLAELRKHRVVLCPAGTQTQETFRMYEAIEAGAAVIVDAYSGPDNKGKGFWQMYDPPFTGAVAHDWANVEEQLQSLLREGPAAAASDGMWWHRLRRNLAARLMQDLGVRAGVHDFTVVMSTSPIPSHPSLEVIERTIASVRERTDAEILVLCDGVRPEQAESRTAAYHRYLRDLAVWANTADNVTPVVVGGWLHQAMTTRRVLEARMVRSPWLLFVEHDTPLMGEIDFDAIIDDAEDEELNLNLVRFMHEDHVLEEYSHLHLAPMRDHPYTPTMQWSQRPHLARTEWYLDLLLSYFDEDDRTMIEDVLHGAAHPGEVLKPRENQKIWDRWRMAVYTPPGDQRRSGHLNGRAADEKFPMYHRGKWQ